MKCYLFVVLSVLMTIGITNATEVNQTGDTKPGDGTFPVMTEGTKPGDGTFPVIAETTKPGDGTFPVLTQFAVVFNSEVHPHLPNCVIFSFTPPVENGETVIRELGLPEYGLVQRYEIDSSGDGTFPVLKVTTISTESNYRDNFNSFDPNVQMNLFEINEEETFQTFLFPKKNEDLKKILKNKNCILR